MKENCFEQLLNARKDRSNDQTFWDKKSNDFVLSFPDIKKIKDEFVFDILEKKNVFDNVSTIVDIGCGIGRHSYYFAQNVDRYVGIDSSSEMLKVAQNNKMKFSLDNCEFQKMKWQECQDKFDLVFASMCPGIQTENDLKKLLDMSNRYIMIKRFLDESTELFDELEIKENYAHIDTGYVYGIINMFWKLDYIPEIFTKHVEINKNFVFDDIMNDKKIMLDYLSDEQRQKKIRLLETYADSEGNIKSLIKQDYAIILVDKKMMNRRFDVKKFINLL